MAAGRHFRHIIAALFASVASGVAVMLLAWQLARPTPNWRSDDQTPVSASFKYLAFPKPNAPLLDASRQARVGTLAHAAIVTQNELTSDFVGVRSPDGPRYVARRELEFVPTNANTQASLAALISAPGGEIRYTVEETPIGPARILFRFSADDDSYTNFIYTATATNVTPLQMTEVNGKRIAFTLASAIPVALLVACAVCFFVWRWTKR